MQTEYVSVIELRKACLLCGKPISRQALYLRFAKHGIHPHRMASEGTHYHLAYVTRAEAETVFKDFEEKHRVKTI
jgi:hypothetical protein